MGRKMKEIGAIDRCIGQKLKEMREKAELEPDALAKTLGVDPQKLESFEQGAESVPTDLFLDFAIVLRFDAIELLKSVALEPDAAPRPAAEKPGYEPELVALLRDFTRIRDPDIRSQVLSLVALAARESEKDGK